MIYNKCTTDLPLLVELLLDLVDAFLANLAHPGEVQASAHTNNWRKSLVTKRISHLCSNLKYKGACQIKVSNTCLHLFWVWVCC